MRLRSSAWWFTVALGLVVVMGAGTSALAADATGTWKWSVTVNNNTRENTLKLKLDGDKLTGTMLNRDNQEVAIDDAKFKDNEV